ncbi:MAG: metallophosphoesterase [Armatimonadetes bacterium]|nr:metallophosphoesterase [Armatimonadota bacterium]
MPALTRRYRCLLVLLAAALASAAPEGRFTIAVIPDTQQEVLRADDTRFGDRLRWLVQQREALGLKMVLQTGDMMNWDTPDHVQFERASAGVRVLDEAGVPFAFALGNHDTAATTVGGSAAPGNVHDNQRTTTTYNRYFPLARFTALGGVFEPGKLDNSWHAFRAAGLDWLVLSVELWPRAAAVAWAREVADAHPRHNVIVITHSYLTSDGRIEPRNGGYGDLSPQYLFDHLVNVCPNVRLVFSGHAGSHGYRAERTQAGQTVHAFLTTYHDNQSNPVRLVAIDPAADALRTWVHCPSLGQDKADGSARTITGMDWIKPE